MSKGERATTTVGSMPDQDGRAPDADLATFLRLSEVLLDEHDLDPGFGAECMRLVAAAAPGGYGPGADVTPMRAMLSADRKSVV